MSVTVLYFASLRDAAGVDREQLPLPASLASLYDELAARHGFSLPVPGVFTVQKRRLPVISRR